MMKVALACSLATSAIAFGVGPDAKPNGHNDPEAGAMEAEHQAVMNRVLEAYNAKDKLTGLADLFEEGQIEFCNPYPHCYTDEEAKAVWQLTQDSLSDVWMNTYPQSMEPGIMNRMWFKDVGNFLVNTMVFGFPLTEETPDGGLAQMTSAFIEWQLLPGSTSEAPKISHLRFHYDEESWHQQLTTAHNNGGDLMIYAPVPKAEQEALIAHAETMFNKVSTISPMGDCPPGTPRGEDGLFECEWTHAWTDPFDNTLNASLCEPAVPTEDHCRHGKYEIGKTLPSEPIPRSWFGPRNRYMIAGDTATVDTVWSSVSADPSGCIESHVQVVLFESTKSTAPEDKGALGKMRLYYGQDLENGAGLVSRYCHESAQGN